MNTGDLNPNLGPTSEAIRIIKERKTRMNPLYRLWNGFPEPRIITLLQTFIYGAILAYGLRQLFYTDSYTEEILSPGIGIAVALTFVVGGLIGVIATPKGYWQFERGGIILVITGLSIHFGWTLIDPMPGIRWGQIVRIGICILFFLMRYSNISWARMDPEK